MYSETSTRDPVVRECAGESTDCARDAKAQQHLAVDVSAQYPEALRRSNRVRNRDGSDRELRSGFESEQRSQQAADAEAADGRNRRGNGGGAGDRDWEHDRVKPIECRHSGTRHSCEVERHSLPNNRRPRPPRGANAFGVSASEDLVYIRRHRTRAGHHKEET